MYTVRWSSVSCKESSISCSVQEGSVCPPVGGPVYTVEYFLYRGSSVYCGHTVV